MSRTHSFRGAMNAVRIASLSAAFVTGVTGCFVMALDLPGLWTIAPAFAVSVVVTVIAAVFTGHAGGRLPSQDGFDLINPATGLPYDPSLGMDMSGQPWRGVRDDRHP